ncbi:hypothetical protein Tco_0347382 [Tanacetum coccineum]
MLALQAEEGEGSGNPSEPQPPPSTAQPTHEEPIPNIESSSPQKTQSPRQALNKDTELPQTSVPIPYVPDEAVHQERGDSVERVATTATSLKAMQDSSNIAKTQSTATPTKIISQSSKPQTSRRKQRKDSAPTKPTTEETTPKEHVSTPSYDPPPSGEDRMQLAELISLCTNLQEKVLDLEKAKTAQAKRKSLDKVNVSKQGRKIDKTKPMFDDGDFAELDVDNAMENVKGDAETQGRNTAKQITTTRDTVNTASINVSVVGPSNVSTANPSTSTVGDIFEDEMIIIVDTLVAIRSTRPRTTSVVIHDVEEEPMRETPVLTVQSQDKGKGKMVEPEPTSKNPIKAQIHRDAEIAQRLFKEEQAQFKREQMIATERAAEQETKDVALIAEFEDVQARMDADALLATRLQEKEREQFLMKAS